MHAGTRFSIACTPLHTSFPRRTMPCNAALQIAFSSSVSHDNIVRLLDVFAEGQQLVIVVGSGWAVGRGRCPRVPATDRTATCPLSGGKVPRFARPALTFCVPRMCAARAHLRPRLAHSLHPARHPALPVTAVHLPTCPRAPDPTPSVPLLQWELISGPDLLDLLNECGGCMPEDMAAFYFTQAVGTVV